ncbi:transcriptional repressor LexA [Sandaracinus amylolyticus]|uniref:LexA repressor n=1 Tax=Sandaracinus amylolyticus TaxID=927083 RepID=A0A0F6W2Z7_9BACT|nr:transcriptional repressor LexA [Sandaracinus amylolyticus]AKF06002.1 SOS-response repressor and protease LexA [Sandaracinus amylolyticus]
MNKLTDRQRMVLEYICESIQDRGYPPTLREIGLKLGIRSTNGVNDHLRALERKGYLTREDMKSRTLRPTDTTLRIVGRGASSISSTREEHELVDVETTREAEAANDDMIEIPILGRVAAGLPIEAIEHHGGDTVRIDRMLLGRGARGGDVFGLRIQGESMIEAGIHDGDYVFVRKQAQAARGTIVIAMVGDEATCKYFYPESTHIRLEPANASIAPILVPKSEWRETQILGVVVGVFRKI